MRSLFPQARSSAPRLVLPIEAVVLARRVVGAAVFIVVGLVMSRVDFQATVLDRDDPPGSGIVLRTEVSTIWVSQAFLDLAQHEPAPLVFRSHEELETYMQRQELGDEWYALTYRGHQVNGETAKFTQVRRACEWSGHFEEFRDVASSIAGKPPRDKGLDFSHAAVGVIPERLLKTNPREAVTELMIRPD
jgi:hypothetical protein